MTVWSRTEAFEEVRTDLWRYLSAASLPEPIASVAEGLFALPRGAIRRLTATHLLLDSSTSKMLEAIDQLLPRMPANTRLTDEELVGRVIGPVDWPRTRQLQLSSGDRRRFVCVPPDRHYDTTLGRVLAFCLGACQILANGASLRGASGPTSRILDSVRRRSLKLSEHTKLAGVRKVLPATKDLGALGRRPGVRPVVDFASRFVDSYEHLNPDTTKAVVESQLLAPADDHELFELQVGFRVVRCFEALGFHRQPPSIIEPGARAPFAVLTKGADRVEMWWQRSVRRILGMDDGLYGEALRSAGLRLDQLLPDFIVHFTSTGRALLVEVKHTSQGRSRVNEGIKDMLLYLMDTRAWFDSQPFPHAIVVANQAEATGDRGGRIMVSDGEVPELRSLIAAVASHSLDPGTSVEPGRKHGMEDGGAAKS